MISAIVPAQITTVEDKVAGNLSIQQLVMLVFPIFVGAGMYAVAPAMFSFAPYKIVVLGIVAFLCLVSAIRIKGTLVVYWIARLLRYANRPRTYVYRHSDSYLREPVVIDKLTKVASNPTAAATEQPLPKLSSPDVQTLKLQHFADAAASYTIQKGGLHVSYVKEK